MEHHERQREIAQPFDGLTRDQLLAKVNEFMGDSGLDQREMPLIQRGIALAQTLRHARPGHDVDPNDIVDCDGGVWVNKEEYDALELEGKAVTVGNLWEKLGAYPATTYWLIACCSLAALVQGFDETAVNGGEYFIPVVSSDRWAY